MVPKLNTKMTFTEGFLHSAWNVLCEETDGKDEADTKVRRFTISRCTTDGREIHSSGSPRVPLNYKKYIVRQHSTIWRPENRLFENHFSEPLREEYFFPFVLRLLMLFAVNYLSSPVVLA